MSLCGSCLMISRSLHVPGSPSSALTTKYFGLPSVTGTFMNDHLRPVGKPAPPRPRRPESLTCCWIHSGPLRIISFVLYQSPRDSAPKKFSQAQHPSLPDLVHEADWEKILLTLEFEIMKAINVGENSVLILHRGIIDHLCVGPDRLGHNSSSHPCQHFSQFLNTGLFM